MVRKQDLQNALEIAIDDESISDDNIKKNEIKAITKRLNILLNQLQDEADEESDEDEQENKE